MSDHGISSALFRPPRLKASAVEVERIQALLDDHADAVNLLLGPPGCGKSTALLQHYRRLEARGRNVIWVTLTDEDNDRDALTEKLAIAFGGAAAKTNWPFQRVPDPSELPGLPAGTHIFIDGFERIHRPTARTLIETFILGLPEDSGCYITAHAVRSGMLHEARLRGVVHCVTHDNFRFTDEAAGELLGGEWPRAQVNQINRIVDGWAAGLRFLAQDGAATRRLLEKGAQGPIPVAMAHYYDDVVCSAIPEATLAALMDASVLNRFNPEAFAAIPDQTNSWQVIEDQLRAGHFLQYLDDARQWVVFHPTFGQHLRERLRCADARRFDRLQRFAALWFRDNGFPMEAMRHAGRLTDGDLATRIIEDAGGLLAELGRGPFMDAEQPAAFSQACELPMVFLSQVYLQVRTGHVFEARQAFELFRARTQGFTLLDSSANAEMVRGFARIIEIVVDITEDRPVDVERIATLEQLMADHLGSDPVIAASIASLLSMAYIELSRFVEASTICDIGFNALRQIGPTKVAIFLRIQQANIALAQDTVGKAVLCIEDGLRLARMEGDFGLYEVVATQILRAELHYEANELEASQALIEASMAQINQVGSWMALCATGHAVAAAIAGIRQGYDAANEYLIAAEGIARRRNLPRLAQSMAIARMRELVRAQMWKEAALWLDDAVFAHLVGAECHSLPELRLQAQALMEAARFALEMGRPAEALAWLDRVNKDYLDDSDVRHRFTFRLLAMRSAFALRRYNAAVEHMLVALGLAMQSGLMRRAITNRLALIEVFDWSIRNGRHVPRAIAAFVNEVLRSAGELETGDALLRRRPRRGPTVVTPNFALSPRETEIIALIAEGYLTKEIAVRLQISDGTVKSHRKKIHEKLGVISKSQAISRARELLII
ncbi:MAG: AAA family ATPase [Sphingomonadales bacterium]|nr:AAA family ATPase [Sphingomonadales bacterium]